MCDWAVSTRRAAPPQDPPREHPRAAPCIPRHLPRLDRLDPGQCGACQGEVGRCAPKCDEVIAFILADAKRPICTGAQKGATKRTRPWSALGIIAGGGELPLAVAESVARGGRPIFVIGLRGCADDGVAAFPHAWAGLGEIGATLKHLRAHHCTDVMLVGRVARPKFSEIKLDAKGVLLLPKVIAAARQGDDALLRVMVDAFERKGSAPSASRRRRPACWRNRACLGRSRPRRCRGRHRARP